MRPDLRTRLFKIVEVTLPKLLRHAAAAASGWLVTHGVTLGDGSTGGIIAGLMAYLAVSAWSALAKSNLDSSKRNFIAKLSEALASQLVAALSGGLLAAGFEGDVADPMAVALFGANYGLSVLSRKDAPGGNGVDTGRLAALVLPCLLLAGCTAAEQAALKETLTHWGRGAAQGVGRAAVTASEIQVEKWRGDLLDEINKEDPNMRKVMGLAVLVGVSEETLKAGEDLLDRLREEVEASESEFPQLADEGQPLPLPITATK
jgi:hypothetical protein